MPRVNTLKGVYYVSPRLRAFVQTLLEGNPDLRSFVQVDEEISTGGRRAAALYVRYGAYAGSGYTFLLDVLLSLAGGRPVRLENITCLDDDNRALLLRALRAYLDA